jgi:hypothetical protein
MDEHIKVPLEEARRVFDFLEKAHELMHQPMSYRDPRRVEKFVEDNYAEARELYYRIVWNWLPDWVRDEIGER